MQKPINLIVSGLEQEIYDLLNRDKLPIAVISMIVDKVQVNVNNTKIKTLSDEQIAYSESLKEEQEKLESENIPKEERGD